MLAEYTTSWSVVVSFNDSLKRMNLARRIWIFILNSCHIEDLLVTTVCTYLLFTGWGHLKFPQWPLFGESFLLLVQWTTFNDHFWKNRLWHRMRSISLSKSISNFSYQSQPVNFRAKGYIVIKDNFKKLNEQVINLLPQNMLG